MCGPNETLASKKTVKATTTPSPSHEKTIKSSLTGASATIVLSTMSLVELRATAKSLNVPVGKSAKNTRENLEAAISDGRAAFKVVAYISKPAADENSRPSPVFIKKLRTYRPDKVLQSPVLTNSADHGY